MAESDLTVTVQVDGGLLAEDQATWDVLTSAFVTEVPHPERVELIITARYEQIAGELAMLSPVRANEEMTATDYRADKPDGALAVARTIPLPDNRVAVVAAAGLARVPKGLALKGVVHEAQHVRLCQNGDGAWGVHRQVAFDLPDSLQFEFIWLAERLIDEFRCERAMHEKGIGSAGSSSVSDVAPRRCRLPYTTGTFAYAGPASGNDPDRSGRGAPVALRHVSWHHLISLTKTQRSVYNFRWPGGVIPARCGLHERPLRAPLDRIADQLRKELAVPSKLLEINGISKSFPGVKALKDVSIDLSSGEILGLCGENGAGKSTLMKLITGIYKADEGGVILFDGQRIDVNGPREAQHLGISIIHQEFNLVPDLTVAQNIYLGREPRKFRNLLLDDGALYSQAKELLGRLEIQIDPRRYVRDLSVARQQMVEIAKAMSFDSRILVMDEPTAALTDSEVETLFTLVRNFVTDQTGVIYISHRMDEIKELTDRVSVLRDGEYVGTVDTESTPIREVIAMMVGREITSSVRPKKQEENGRAVLEVQELSTHTFLKDVSFDLREGEILGFAGLMGAGRTEVARALVGVDHKSAGVIKIHGEEVSISNPADAVAAGVGYLSEDRKRYGLLLDQDVSANLALSSLGKFSNAIGFINARATMKAAERQVASLRIKTPSIRQTVQNLSGGNQQKVVIGKWLTRDCDVLIFDEPTRGIDVGAKEEIYDLLEKLTAAGKSIILISSELPEILRLSNRIAVMCEGRVTSILTPDEATPEVVMHFATLRQPEGPGGVAEPDLIDSEKARKLNRNTEEDGGER